MQKFAAKTNVKYDEGVLVCRCPALTAAARLNLVAEGPLDVDHYAKLKGFADQENELLWRVVVRTDDAADRNVLEETEAKKLWFAATEKERAAGNDIGVRFGETVARELGWLAA